MTDVTTIHQPVLLRDCVDLVAPALANPGSIAVDCTLGLAGHSTAFLKASPHARLIGIDRDTEALALATQLGNGYEVSKYASSKGFRVIEVMKA